MWTEIYIFELEFSRFTSEIKTERTLKFNILWKKKKKWIFSIIREEESSIGIIQPPHIRAHVCRLINCQ